MRTSPGSLTDSLAPPPCGEPQVLANLHGRRRWRANGRGSTCGRGSFTPAKRAAVDDTLACERQQSVCCEATAHVGGDNLRPCAAEERLEAVVLIDRAIACYTLCVGDRRVHRQVSCREYVTAYVACGRASLDGDIGAGLDGAAVRG